MKLRYLIVASLLSILAIANIANAQNYRTSPLSNSNVYVMENDPQDNEIVAYYRFRNGRLLRIGNFSTQGLGAGDNAAADPLGSQNSLILSENNRFLYAVNAGSDDISVFSLRRFGIPVLIQKISSNGDFPVSMAIDKNVLYVLNSGSDGAISGFRMARNGRLTPIGNSTRALGLGATSFPEGDARNLAPGDISFDNLNRRLLITYAGGGAAGQLLSFSLNNDDTPADLANVIESEGAVPFSIDFSQNGAAVIAEASGSLSSYNYNDQNELINVSSVIGNSQQATCWVQVSDNNFVYTTNTVSGTISQYSVERSGELSLINATAASDIGLPIDFGLTRNQRFMYVVSSNEGGVRGFRVNRRTGALTSIGLFTGLPTFDGDGFAPQGIAIR